LQIAIPGKSISIVQIDSHYEVLIDTPAQDEESNSAEIAVITNEHSRPPPDWVPRNVVAMLFELKTYVESHMRAPGKPYIFTWPDFGSENEDIVLGKI
jgi:hypothetical protein